MEPRCCFVCMESEPPPIQYGCACRSDTGLIHTECAIAAATARAAARGIEDAWLVCATCGQEPTGPMRTALSEARVGWSVQFGPAALARAHMHLARTHIVNGQYARAEAMLPVLVAETRPGDHEGTWSMLTITAECFKNLGRHAEAEAIYRRLVASLPPGSYDAMCARSNLARLLLDMGQVDESRALHEGVVVSAKTHVHPDSPDMIGYESDLALSMLYNRDDRPTAERALRGLVARSTRALGPAHPCTLMTKAHLAHALHRQRRNAEAVRVQLELMDHASPDDMHSLKINLATYLSGTDEWRMGLSIGHDALESHRLALGDTHPDTLMCGLSLAWSMVRCGMVADAEAIARTVRSSFDPTSTSAIGASHCLAICLAKQGKRAEGLRLMTELASACRSAFGDGHASTAAVTRMVRAMTMACDADGCVSPGGLTCAGCKAARYCSSACQRRDWKRHKSACSHHDPQAK